MIVLRLAINIKSVLSKPQELLLKMVMMHITLVLMSAKIGQRIHWDALRKQFLANSTSFPSKAALGNNVECSVITYGILYVSEISGRTEAKFKKE